MSADKESLEERQERLRVEKLALANPHPDAIGSRILTTLSSFGFSRLYPNGVSSTPPEGVMARGAASVLRAVAVALSHEYPDGGHSYVGPMPSEIEFTTDDAVSALGLVAQYLDHGAELVSDIRLVRLDQQECEADE